jgi:hypothetical protein
MQVHMDATLDPARRMITKLLKADAGFFREYHYLNPLMVDPAIGALGLGFRAPVTQPAP